MELDHLGREAIGLVVDGGMARSDDWPRIPTWVENESPSKTHGWSFEIKGVSWCKDDVVITVPKRHGQSVRSE